MNEGRGRGGKGVGLREGGSLNMNFIKYPSR